MRFPLAPLAATICLPALAWLVLPGAATDPSPIRGIATGPGGPVAGVQVVGRSLERPVAVAIVTGPDGRFELPLRVEGGHRIEAAGGLWTGAAGPAGPGSSVTLELQPAGPGERLLPGSAWLGLLPGGEARRKFILDCTGCHQFNETRALHHGVPRPAEQWARDVARMLGFAGAESNFPVIAADRDPAATGLWLHQAVAAGYPARLASPGPWPETAARAVITEYDLPVARDLPHDLAVDSTGRIIITGMFSDRIFRLDPATGAVDETPIPVAGANPRAVELDRAGNWYVLLGGPKAVARRDIRSGTWSTFAIGMYPHSIAVSADGGTAWFNGHFTRAPILVGRLDLATGAVQTVEMPLHPVLSAAGGPIPYEQRVAPDGTVWMSELSGNRIVALDPATRRTEAFDLPTPHSGPRRFDVAPDGVLWIPAYSGNALVRFDRRRGEFREFPLPAPDMLPYVARVHPRTGDIWIGTAAADAIVRFQPQASRFTVYPVPTRGATMRHMAIDPRSGDVWVAYGASPALHPSRVARLALR